MRSSFELSFATTALIISNEKMNNIMKIVRSLEESGLLIKGVGQKIKNETKEQKGGVITKRSNNKGTIRVGEGIVRASKNF